MRRWPERVVVLVGAAFVVGGAVAGDFGIAVGVVVFCVGLLVVARRDRRGEAQ